MAQYSHVCLSYFFTLGDGTDDMGHLGWDLARIDSMSLLSHGSSVIVSGQLPEISCKLKIKLSIISLTIKGRYPITAISSG